MFRREWARQRGNGAPRRMAIVDDHPEEQYLYPEFVLASRMLRRHGIDVIVAHAGDLQYKSGRLNLHGDEIDLVYNRLVDFALQQPEHAALSAAYREGAVVVTPNPHNYALLANKRNLTLLSKPAAMAAFGLPPESRAPLVSIPKTRVVTPENADQLWQERMGCSSSQHQATAARRYIVAIIDQVGLGGHCARRIRGPGHCSARPRMIELDGVLTSRKMDVRLYTYDGQVLLVAARLYQGQTTNFRTFGGGFASVLIV